MQCFRSRFETFGTWPIIPAEASDDNPVFSTICTSLQRKLGVGAGSPCGAPTSSNDHRCFRAGKATGINDWSADANHDQSSWTGRNSDATNTGEPGSNSNWSRATGAAEYTDGAVSNFASDSAEWKRGNSSIGYGSHGTCTAVAFRARRANLEFRTNGFE